MSKLQSWTRKRNLDKGHISAAMNQLRTCKSLTLREKEIADLCIGYLSGVISRWDISSPTSKREYIQEESTNADS